MKLVSKTDKGVYGALKREMWRETLQYLENWGDESRRDVTVLLEQKKEDIKREENVKGWEVKAKL